MIEQALVTITGEHGILEFFELDQTVQGTPEGDGVPPRVPAVKQAGSITRADDLDNQSDDLAAVAIHFAFQAGREKNFGCREKVIDNIVVIPVFFAKAYVLAAYPAQFFIGRQIQIGGLENPGEEYFQAFFLEVGENLLFILVVEIDGADPQFSLFGDLVDGGGLQALVKE